MQGKLLKLREKLSPDESEGRKAECFSISRD
jgi:hypothetical protein